MEFYFVLNGLFQGERGNYARTAGVGKQQKDGWYYLPNEIDDGYGPYESWEDARDAANLYEEDEKHSADIEAYEDGLENTVARFYLD